MYEVRNEPYEPTVLGAAWQFRWLVLFLALAFAGFGWLYGTNREAWTAQATMTVKDPRTSGVFDQAFTDTSSRYVTGQAEIAGSRTVAHRAAELIAEGDQAIVIDDQTIVDDIGISSDDNSDQIVVSFTSADSATAIAVVNAVTSAYKEVASVSSEASFTAALEQLDREIVNREREIADVQQQINEIRNSDSDLLSLQAKLDAAKARLILFEPTSASATPEQSQAAQAVLEEINLQITTLQNAIATTVDDPQIVELLDQQAAAQNRLGDLKTRRDELSVDADLATNVVPFLELAETAEPASAGIMVILGLILGSVLGSTIALLLARSRRRFRSRAEPERVLGTRLLADVPLFFEERLKTLIPMIDSPYSVSAESFRFVSAALALQQNRQAGDPDSSAFHTVVVTSSGGAEGKTVVCANLAFAAAFERSRVLVIDADFGNQVLTQLLLGDEVTPLGITDAINGSVDLEDAITTIDRGTAGSIDLLARGRFKMAAPDFAAAPETAELLDRLSGMYDLILIDSPPLLRVAYATTLARLADRALVVVTHGRDLRGTAELRAQLDLVGTPLVGYVYNQAPLRAEMAATIGSTLDPLGISPDPAGGRDGQSGDAVDETTQEAATEEPVVDEPTEDGLPEGGQADIEVVEQEPDGQPQQTADRTGGDSGRDEISAE
jgi:Mrp family chromosome partitioning ATPase